MGNKNGYIGKHSKSSAAVVSLAIHAVLIVVAISFVAVRVYVKEEQTFEAKPMSRPKMQIKKLQVPVNVKKKKIQKPKLRKRIVAKPKTKSVDIAMPEMSGVKGGTGYLNAGGLGGIGFDLDLDLFGGSKGSGNELEGTFYDLKMKPDGKPSGMEVKPTKEEEKRQNDKYAEVIRNFGSSWTPSRLENRYFKAPNKKFATTFMVPYMKAEEAPKAYGVDDVVQPRRWVAYYNGKIAAPETGRYRFWGLADDVLGVRIKGKTVIDASFLNFTGWESKDERNRKYRMAKSTVFVGDWFSMKKGEPVDMEVFIGECPGGYFYCFLMVEQEGVTYPKGKDGRPILPIFKTAEIPEKLIKQMKIDPSICTPEGPTFGVMK